MIAQLTYPIKSKRETPFVTKEAKAVYEKTLTKIESHFSHPQTKEILERFIHAQDKNLILQSITQITNSIDIQSHSSLFLSKRQLQKALPYSVLIVTENEDLYEHFKKKQLLVQLIINQKNFDFLLDYDIVQAIDCSESSYMLRDYDHVLFYDDVRLVNPEQYLKKLYEYRESILQIREKQSVSIADCKVDLEQLLSVLDTYMSLSVQSLKIDEILGNINSHVEQKLTLTSLSAFELLAYQNKQTFPPIILDIVEDIISQSGIPVQCFTQTIPVDIHKDVFKKYQKQKETEQIIAVAKYIKEHAKDIVQIQKHLETIHVNTLIFDFAKGIVLFTENIQAQPINVSDELCIVSSKNMYLKNAQPIDYELTREYPAALLTGANSGGKTTLLEHILTLCALSYIGLGANGQVKLPSYDAIYYFAKNKGSANKGAFETMLLQLAKIKTNLGPNSKILVLADEMEAVTEPSVAAKVIAKTIAYFVSQNCHCIFATHLGAILQSHIGANVRIDGIVAVGFDADDNIIINHNPALHTLAASTPELIIQKLAKQHKDDFLIELAKAI
jgi:DNA mismatch repair protein MutS2